MSCQSGEETGMTVERKRKFFARLLDDPGYFRVMDMADLVGRKSLLGHLVDDESFEYFLQNGCEKWHSRAQNIIQEHQNKG